MKETRGVVQINPGSTRFPRTLLTAALMVAIAGLAAVSLWSLRRMHDRLTHATATQTVLDAGQLITAYLAGQPEVATVGVAGDWGSFSRLVRSLHTVEGGLEYVSVTSDGETLFQEQMRGFGREDGVARDEAVAVDVSRRLLAGLGRDPVPVVTFSTAVPAADGRSRTVEVALRRDTVAREESLSAGVALSMFRLSLATVGVSFLLGLAAVLWILRRESVRERERREQDHLAFAGVMANGIVHDFRNPMSSLRLDLQMIAREAANREAPRLDRLVQLAERARDTIDRMDRIFQEFFHLSRPPAEARERVDLEKCLAECVDLFKPRIEQKRLDVRTRIEERGLKVRVDAVSLRRALINVLGNAEHFSPEAGVLDVRVGRSKHSAVVEVRDRGPGVPLADRRRVFEMFVSTRPGGTGLGLFLAKSAVDRCGGTIEIVGPPDEGACVRLTLPLSEEDDVAPAATAGGASKEKAGGG